MNISKTTINMAKRRGISIEVMSDSQFGEVVEITRIEDGEVLDEYAALYVIRDGGMFFVNGCDDRVAEEFAYWIKDDSELRSHLDVISVFI